MENACAACNVISEAWCQRNNAEAMEDLIKNQGVIAQTAAGCRGQGAARGEYQGPRRGGRKDPMTKKVHESYMAYMARFRAWAGYSEAVYHGKILRG